MDKQLTAIWAVFGAAVWAIWLLFSAVGQYLRARSQAAAQDKLLHHVSSPESLEVFLASEAGREFLRSLEPNPKEIWRSIIRSSQTAVIFAVLGVGLLLGHLAFREADGLVVFSFGAFVLAAAFGASAVVSLALHRRSGLLSSDGK